MAAAAAAAAAVLAVITSVAPAVGNELGGRPDS